MVGDYHWMARMAPPYGLGYDGDAVHARTKVETSGSYPLLSCADIVSLLKYALPKRAVTQEEILRQMEIRHKKRKSAMESARKIQAERLAAELAGAAM